jgi:hypothetical protein
MSEYKDWQSFRSQFLEHKGSMSRRAHVSKFKSDAVEVVWKEIKRIEDQRATMVRETVRLAMNHVMGGSTLAELNEALRQLTAMEREEVIRALE